MHSRPLQRSNSDIPDVVYERRVLKYLPPDMTESDWEAVVDIFMVIDIDLKGYIKRSELADYFRIHGIPLGNVEKWFEWFGGKDKDIITMEDVCSRLGIPMRKEYTEKVERKRSAISEDVIPMPAEAPRVFAAAPPMGSISLMEGVEMIHRNPVPDDILEGCIQFVKDYPGVFKEEQEMARYLKEHMEMKFKKHWQVVVASSTIGCVVSHEPQMFLHFRYNNYIYILYRVPDYRSL